MLVGANPRVLHGMSKRTGHGGPRGVAALPLQGLAGPRCRGPTLAVRPAWATALRWRTRVRRASRIGSGFRITFQLFLGFTAVKYRGSTFSLLGWMLDRRKFWVLFPSGMYSLMCFGKRKFRSKKMRRY